LKLDAAFFLYIIAKGLRVQEVNHEKKHNYFFHVAVHALHTPGKRVGKRLLLERTVSGSDRHGDGGCGQRQRRFGGLLQPGGPDTELEGARVMGGVTVYDVSGTFNSDDGTSADLENSPIPLPHLYASWKAGQKLAVGLGVFSDFGLATDWQDDWSGRFILGSTYAESMAVNLNPVVAYAIIPRELPEST
jgi:hypothetical protein